jgi:threonine synthase
VTAYVSTRGRAGPVTFADALLAGTAPDGGLWVPATWPSLPDPAGDDWEAVATAVLEPFAGGDVSTAVAEAAATFDHPDVLPLVDLGDVHLLELFHGPTLAFKDVALQVVGRLVDAELSRRGERATVVVATSGDTGSAAIEACRGRAAVDVAVLHPAGRVSEVQRRLMTTVDEPNVLNLAVDGTFDDCQAVVKALFRNERSRVELRLTAMNSINWARLAVQVAPFVLAARRLGGGPVSFSVPSGNFGNAYSAWVAATTGLPVPAVVVGSNRNDVLARWLATGRLEPSAVRTTISPSMDVQVASNAERLLFELAGRDGSVVAAWMADLAAGRPVDVGPERAARLAATFPAASVDDETTMATMADVHRSTGVLVDPHTAVGVAAARATAASRPGDGPVVCLATAHPAKFPDAVAAATGVRPALPDRLADLLHRPERVTAVPADPAAVLAEVVARFAVRA